MFYKSNKRLFNILIGAALLLLIPLLLQATIGTGIDGDGFNWKLNDFIMMGVLLFGTGLVVELVIRYIKSFKKRIVLIAVIFLLLLLIWIDLAVGILNISGFSGS